MIGVAKGTSVADVMKSSPRTIPKPTNKVPFTTILKPTKTSTSLTIGMLFSRLKGSVREKCFDNLQYAHDSPGGSLVQLYVSKNVRLALIRDSENGGVRLLPVQDRQIFP